MTILLCLALKILAGSLDLFWFYICQWVVQNPSPWSLHCLTSSLYYWHCLLDGSYLRLENDNIIISLSIHTQYMECLAMCMHASTQVCAVVCVYIIKCRSAHINKVNKYCLAFTEVDVKELVNICHKESSVTFPVKGSQLLSSWLRHLALWQNAYKWVPINVKFSVPTCHINQYMQVWFNGVLCTDEYFFPQSSSAVASLVLHLRMKAVLSHQLS